MTHIILTPLRRIAVPGGDVLHGVKRSDVGFVDFGEAYFSTIREGYVKGWKRHSIMTLNFVVPVGLVRVCVRGDGTGADTAARYFLLGPDAPDGYARLTIGPGMWVAFGGVTKGDSILLNIASIEHDPIESESVPLETFPWDW